ncbi:hypothetical protein GGR56DRAFT_620164 [Xylariaceae sp. FL0804]|nr:hypothetical protein GGR56DRAFT_620164 [Xylariaceae sp. FL0804]
MAMWPFRRRGSRRRSRTAPVGDSDYEASARGRQDRPLPRREVESATATMRRASRGKRDGSNKLQRRNRAYSFSPGRRDTLRVAKTRQESVPPLPPVPSTMTNGVYGDPDGSGISNDDLAGRVPTLHHDNSRNKRRGQPLPRKKSSKRRKEDHDREAEIKAMSQFMPARAATDSWTAGLPVKTDSKRYKTGLNRHWDEPSSDVSLPLPDSIHSARSSDSEGVSWKVSSFAALAPRPTLRYASNPVYGAASGSGPVRSQSTRRRTVERGTITEATLKAHKRVDDLADDLGAADLRELMERDRRRKEKKIEKEQERVQRRLARRAEKQRAAEAAAARSGSPLPPNLERGVMGREMPGSSSGEQTSAIITSSRRRPSNDSVPRSDEQAAQTDEPERRKRTPSPLDEFHRTESIPNQPSSPVIEPEHEPEPKVEPSPEPEAPPSSRSPSPRILSLIRSRKSSRSPKATDQGQAEGTQPTSAPVKHDDTESASRTSDSRSSRKWMSFWSKWGKNRRSSGPSSFSNTSRDSMLASQPPPPPPPMNYMPSRKPSTGRPKRTMSRFREDLPELPLSPPDSRVASPEAEPFVEPLPVIPDDVPMRYDTPTSNQHPQDAMRANPYLQHRDGVQPSPVPHSMSLASIDSEASWLSGRVSRKRASSGMRNSLPQPPRTVSALSGASEGLASEQTDDDNFGDDEYLRSVVPPHLQRHSTGEARPSSDEEEGQNASEPKWGAVGQTPIMHHRETMRSREGLLQSFDDDKISQDSEGDYEEGQSPGEPQRARSVNLKKSHIRNFSAGSAKLLDISPRPSGEHRRSGLVEQATQ